jgi:regulatory protein
MPSKAIVTKVSNNAEPKIRPGSPWATALRILTRRDHSQAELRKRLTDKGFDAEQIEITLQRCLDLGYLDDARYALTRAASLMNQGRAVGHRVLADLRQRGISDELADQALAAAREGCDEETLLADLLTRRFPGFDYETAPAGEKRRVVNFLQRRGFETGRILEHLMRKGSATDNENR